MRKSSLYSLTQTPLRASLKYSHLTNASLSYTYTSIIRTPFQNGQLSNADSIEAYCLRNVYDRVKYPFTAISFIQVLQSRGHIIGAKNGGHYTEIKENLWLIQPENGLLEFVLKPVK